MLNLLQDLQQRYGVTYLFISHDLAVVDHVCDEVAVLHAGRVVEQGAPATRVRAPPAHPYTRALLAALPDAGWRPQRPPDVPRGPAAPPRRVESPASTPAAADAPAAAGCAYAPRCP